MAQRSDWTNGYIKDASVESHRKRDRELGKHEKIGKLVKRNGSFKSKIDIEPERWTFNKVKRIIHQAKTW